MPKFKVWTSCLVARLRGSGARLADPPDDGGQLLSLLNNLRYSLGEVDQQPDKRILEVLEPTIKALIADRLFRHEDADVRVAVASCIVELMRITAPEVPYEDEQMKVVFQLIVSSFENLRNISSHSFKKRASILHTVANVRSCVIMLDLECDALILEMFQYFLNEIRDHHPYYLFVAMENIMITVFEESDDISPELLSLLLDTMKKNNEEVQRMAKILVEHVLQKTANYVKTELMLAIKTRGHSINDYNEVVAGICQEARSAVKQHKPNVATASKQQVVTGLSKGEATGKRGTSGKTSRKVGRTKKKEALKTSSVHANAEFPKISEAAGNSGRRMHAGSNRDAASGTSDEVLPLTVKMSNKDTGTSDSEMTLNETGTKGKESNAQISSFKMVENRNTNVGSLLPNEKLRHEKPYRIVRPPKKEGLKRSPAHANTIFGAAGDSERTMHSGSLEKATSGLSHENQPLTVQMSNKDSVTSDEEMTPNETEIKGEESDAQISSFKIVESRSTNVGSLLPNENLLYGKPDKMVGPTKKKEGLKRSPVHANAEFQKIPETADDSEGTKLKGCNKKEIYGVSDEDQPLTVQTSNKDSAANDVEMTLKEAETTGQDRNAQLSSLEIVPNRSTNVEDQPLTVQTPNKDSAASDGEMTLKETGTMKGESNAQNSLFKTVENCGTNVEDQPLTVQTSDKKSAVSHAEMTLEEAVTKGEENNAQISSFKIIENWSTNVGSLLPIESLLHEKPYKNVGSPKKKDGLKRSPVHANADFQKIPEAAGDSERRMQKGSNKKAASGVSNEDQSLTVQKSNMDSAAIDADNETVTKGEEGNAQISLFMIVENRSTNVGSQLPIENLLHEKPYINVGPPKKKYGLKRSPVHANAEFQKTPEAAASESERRMHKGFNKKATSGVSDECHSLSVKMSCKNNGSSGAETPLEETTVRSDASRSLAIENIEDKNGFCKVVKNDALDSATKFHKKSLTKDNKEKIFSPNSSKILSKAEYQKETKSKGKRKSEGDSVSNIKIYGADLVHRRIEVLWPMDKTFYSGIVESYDPVINKHKVLYDDEDVEILDMQNEIWDFADNECESNEEKVSSLKSSKISCKAVYKETSGRNYKRKRMRESKVNTYGVDLVHCRIRVFWPLDKAFYSGIVESYNPVVNKHKVLYDDGDVEILDMQNEIWDFADNECESDEEKVSSLKSSEISCKALYRKEEISGTNYKRKRMRESNVNKYGVDLVHCRIRVFWPLDKAFYSGIVESYDPVVNKHKVLYDDGDVEILDMRNEIWDFADNESESNEVSSLKSFKKSCEAVYREAETSGTNYKRKRMRESRVNNYGVDLVHCRIRVFWPLDKAFYSGIVESYNPVVNKHKVLYDDGDVEILDMQNEIWDFADNECESDEENVSSLRSSEISCKAVYRKEETSGRNYKRKRMSESKVNKYGVDLVHRRIRVFWPLDKAFYSGIVESYDPLDNKHKVLYDDGDIEILDMQNEIWDFADNECESNEEEAVDPPVSDSSLKLPAERSVRRASTSGITSRNGGRVSFGRAQTEAMKYDHEAGDGEKLRENSQNGTHVPPKIVENQHSNVRSFLPRDNLLHEKPSRKGRQLKKKDVLKRSLMHANAESKKEPANDSEVRLSTFEEDEGLLTVKMISKLSGKDEAKITLKEAAMKGDATKSLANQINVEKEGRGKDVRRDILNSAMKFHEKSLAKDDQEEKVSSLKSSMKSCKAAYMEEKSGTNYKRKRMRVGDRESKVNKYGEDLVHCRIRVWWPLDKAFYKGIVESYDPSKNKHTILYDDGDVEVLNMKNELWELI